MSAPVPLDVETLLERFVRGRLPAAADDVHIGEVDRVAVGLSRENWVFDLTWTEGAETRTRPLIVRRDPPGGLLDTDRSTEFAVLQAVGSAGVHAPRALWLDPDGSELGRPSLVMERGTGRCDYFVLNGDLPLERRVRLAERLCDLLADIHRLDWGALGLGEVLTDPGPQAARQALEEWTTVLRAQQVEPLPELDLIVDWLAADPPRSPRTVLVHGDFKAGNVLLDEDDAVVLLLDWELAHLGDPHDDLGWITQPLRTREHLIPGAWDRPELFARWERRTGLTVDAAAVRWWNVMACLKTAIMQVTGLASWLDGRTDTMYRLTNGCVLAALDLMEGPDVHPTVDEQLDGIARLIEQAAGDLTAGDLAADDLAAGPMADRLRTAAGTLRRLAAAWPAVLPFLTWDNAATLRLLDTLGEVPGSGVAAIAARAHAVAAAPLDPLDAAEVHARNLELRGLLAEAVRALPPARPPSEGPSGDDPARVARSSVAAHVRARIARDPSGGRPRPGPSPTLTPSPDLAPRPNPT